MENIKMVILTEDESYGEALARGILKLHSNFSVQLRKPGEVDNELMASNDIVLIDNSVKGKETHMDEESPKCVFLVEKKSQESLEERAIWKYGNVHDAARMLIKTYEACGGRSIADVEKRDVAVYGFFSAAGGCGCTSVAMGCAQELKRFYGKQVFYVSLEEMESYCMFMEIPSSGKRMNEFVYKIIADKDCASMIEQYVICDEYGIEAISSPSSFNALRGLSQKELVSFFNAIAGCGRYDDVVIDFGTFHDRGKEGIFEMCSSLAYVTAQGSAGLKAKLFEEHMRDMAGDRAAEKVIKVINMHVEENNEETEEDKTETENHERTVIIEKDDGSFSLGEKLSISIDRTFGEGVRKLVKLMRNCDIIN